MTTFIRSFVTLGAIAGVVVTGCAKDKGKAGDAPTTRPIAAMKPKPVVQPSVGMQQRFGDELVVAGHLYRIGTPVVTWMDPGGYDAYRTARRFAPLDQAAWEPTTQEMAAGKLKFVSSNQQFKPDRYSVRSGGPTTQSLSEADVERIARGGWSLEELRDRVDQFVLHYDVAGTSANCFKVLHDSRGLSVHLMLDIDGTIYQTADLKESTWHASKANPRSVGIEIANMGSYSTGESTAVLQRWYKKDERGQTYIAVPESLGGENGTRVPGIYRPARNEPVVGQIRGVTQRMYDLTPQQYEALIKLTAALGDIFPKIELDYPRGPDGELLTRTLTESEWDTFNGVLGHYHVQSNKSDPGVALQWDYVIENARRLLAERKSGIAAK
jgi:N-acetylmuramoyl-L-alanine amidase